MFACFGVCLFKRGEKVSPMSLRFRLVSLIALIVCASLALGSALAWRHATRSVRTEMRSALAVGEHKVSNALPYLGGNSDALLELSQLIRTFDGDRHLRATLTNPGGEIVTTSALERPARPVPKWFAALLGGNDLTSRLALPASVEEGGAIVLATDPQNEMTEVWTEFRDNIAIMAAFGGLTLILVRWLLGRALQPLGLLSRAFVDIGSGRYSAQLPEEGAPEFLRLAQGFNAMAQRLSEAEARNRRLHDQIATIQEEERAELARDLHDEVGTHLFAIGIDAAQIARTARSGGHTEIVALVRSLQNSVVHIQQHVRSILARLRPAELDELGLSQALQALVGFWRDRRPEIAITIELDDRASFDEATEDAIYRIVQESLSNAVRHGDPKRITVTVAIDRTGVATVAVVDDGGGLAGPPGQGGLGLKGMSERVARLGGSLTISNRPDGAGAVVKATLPAAPASSGAHRLPA